MKKIILIASFFLFFLTVSLISFTVSQGIGVGLLGKDSSVLAVPEEEVCVSYGIGNPGSENITAKIDSGGNISYFYSRNIPDGLFVPSGTFYYNNSCCLLPASICFKGPYVFKYTKIKGNVYATFARAGTQIDTTKTTPAQTGVAVGSSISHKLELAVSPVSREILAPGTTACFKYYYEGNYKNWGVSDSLKDIYDNTSSFHLWDYNEFDQNAVKPIKYGPGYCFTVPFLTFGGNVYAGDLLVEGVPQQSLKIMISINYYLISVVCLILVVVGWLVYRIRRKK